LSRPSAELCRRPYPGHPRGCPNLGKKQGCPKVPLLGEVLDGEKLLWAAWNCFLFGEHVARLREKHPKWSKRQLECCLYWQGTARKQLEMVLEIALMKFPAPVKDTLVLRCPEAHGVDVTTTMLSLGVKLEWPPVTVAYQVALIGVAKR
jgi:hypothetical protein